MSRKFSIWAIAVGAIYLCFVSAISPVNAEEHQDWEDIDPKPFAQGDMEIGAGLGMWSEGGYFALTIAGNYAYYVIPRLAPGIDLQYTVTWGDLEYPQSFTVLPFVKYVLVRSYRFAPYLVLTGGRDFEWGGTSNQLKGFAPVDAWIIGGGIGAQIGISPHLAVRISLLALYFIYDETVRVAGEDAPVDSFLSFPVLSVGLSFNL